MSFTTMLLLNIVQGVIVFEFMLSLVDNPHKFWQGALASVVLFTLHSIVALYAPMWIMILFFAALNLLVLMTICRVTLHQGLTLVLIQLLTSTFLEYLLAFLIQLFNKPVTYVMLEDENYFFTKLLGNLLWIICLVLVKKTKVKKYVQVLYTDSPKSLVVKLLFLYLLTTPYLMNLYDNVTTAWINVHLHYYNIIIMVALIIYCFVQSYYVGKVRVTTGQLQETTGQLRTEIMYAETLGENLQQLRAFKHDLENVMSSIHGLVTLEDYGKLKVLLNDIHYDLRKINITNTVNKNLKKMPELYGVILSKISLIRKLELRFEISVEADNIDDYDMSPADLSRIVGILLDNSIEEASHTTDKYLRLQITEYRRRLHLTVSNSCVHDVDTDRIFAQGYTGKEGHTGIGLSEVRQIINRYREQDQNVQLKTTCRNLVFTQDLII